MAAAPVRGMGMPPEMVAGTQREAVVGAALGGEEEDAALGG